MARIDGVADREAGPFVRLAYHFTRRGLTRLTHLIALENLRGRFNIALGVEAAGFSAGMACVGPQHLPTPDHQPASTPTARRGHGNRSVHDNRNIRARNRQGDQPEHHHRTDH